MNSLGELLVMLATAMRTLEPASTEVQMIDFWSLEMPKVPGFFLYTAELVTWDAALGGAILKICWLLSSQGNASPKVDQRNMKQPRATCVPSQDRIRIPWAPDA